MVSIIRTDQFLGYRVDFYDDGTQQIEWEPGSEQWNRRRVIARLHTAVGQLDVAAANWAALTTEQRQQALALAVRCAADMARLVLGRFAEQLADGPPPPTT